MKIIVSKEIENFIKKCEKNIGLNRVNDSIETYFDRTIMTEERFKQVKSLYKQAGRNVNKFVYDAKILLNNPYYSNIKLSEVSSGRFKYATYRLNNNIFSNVSFEKPIDAYLSSHIDMGVLSEAVDIPMLLEDDDVWMSITPAEIESMKEHVKAAKKNVLTFGLGMGYYQYMVALKTSVKTVTIVEKDIEVINLFNKYILPQFGDKADKIKIIHGDLFEYWNKDFLNSFDYVFVDVWKGPVDGLEIVSKMFKNYLYKGSLGIWIEYSLYYFYRLAMLTYFRVLCGEAQLGYIVKSNPTVYEYYEAVEKYFNGIDKQVTTQNELKYYLNSNEVYREILSIK